MSSFIISKKEFVKAAGLMCGFEEAKRDSDKWFIDNVRKEFEHAYALNVASVNEQYNDSEMPETEQYNEVFEAYRKKGALIQNDGYASNDGIIFEKVEGVMDKKKFRLSMFHFFESVLYQIENDAASRIVAAWFFTCLSHLYDSDLHSAAAFWWGEIDMAA